MATTQPPSNMEIEQVLDTMKEGLEATRKETSGINQTGHQIISASERLLDDTKALLEEKNPNDLIQKMIVEAQEASQSIQMDRGRWKELTHAANNFDTEEMRTKMRQIVKAVQLVSLELLSSESFRNTLWDFFGLLYSVFIDATGVEKRLGAPLRETWEKEGAERRANFKHLLEEGIKYGLDVVDEERQVVKLNREQVDALVDQFAEVMHQVNERERTQRAMRHMMELFELLKQPSVQVTAEAGKVAEGVVEDPHLQKMGQLALDFLVNFIGDQRVHAMFEHFGEMYKVVLQDADLDRYFHDIEFYLTDLLNNPNNLARDDFRDRAGELIDRGRDLFNSKKEIRKHFHQLLKEGSLIIDHIQNDPYTSQLQSDIQRLVQLIILDEKGQVAFKPDALEQLRVVVTSAILKRFRFPMPTIEYDDGHSLAFAVTGVLVDVMDLMPNRIVAQHRGIAVLETNDLQPTLQRAVQGFSVKLENINVHVPEADIWFHRKTFPRAEDAGVVAFDIGGRGMDLLITFQTSASSDRLFTLEHVESTIHELNMKLSQTHHDTYYNLVITLFKPLIKRQIEGAIEDSMASAFDAINQQLQTQLRLAVQQAQQALPYTRSE